MTALHAFIDGVAFWSPALPGWGAARAAFRGEATPAAPTLRRPAPEMLAPAERRRATDSVCLALEVAAHAVAQSGLDAAQLLSVFTSAHGDLGVTDYVCSTLVNTPLLLSPTKFHNSVHNAASGYWSMATGCLQASTAVSAFEHSFAAGLLEALVQCSAEARPVLLVGCDIEACGPLAGTTASRGLLGVALVLVPERSARSSARLDAALVLGTSASVPLRTAPARAHSGNAMADALPLFEALALAQGAALRMPLTAQMSLQLETQVLQTEGSYSADALA